MSANEATTLRWFDSRHCRKEEESVWDGMYSLGCRRDVTRKQGGKRRQEAGVLGNKRERVAVR